jgi:hypothetical protein
MGIYPKTFACGCKLKFIGYKMPGMSVEVWAWSREEAMRRFPSDLVLATDDELTRGAVCWTSRLIGGDEGGRLVMYPVEGELRVVKYAEVWEMSF